MKFSFLDIKNARPEKKSYRLSDGKGLSIQVQTNGHKLWRYRYRFAGVERLLALGTFPATSLADARAKRGAARKRLESGKDPAVEKRLERLAAQNASRNTFGLVGPGLHSSPVAEIFPRYRVRRRVLEIANQCFPAVKEWSIGLSNQPPN